MTDNSKVGTYTGLYYLFSTLAAIAGPNINGWIVYLTGNNYGLVWKETKPYCNSLSKFSRSP